MLQCSQNLPIIYAQNYAQEEELRLTICIQIFVNKSPLIVDTMHM